MSYLMHQRCNLKVFNNISNTEVAASVTGVSVEQIGFETLTMVIKIR